MGYAAWPSCPATGDLFPAEEHPQPDCAVRVWDTEAGNEVYCLKGLVGDVWCVAMTADGRRALVAGQDCSLLLLDVTSGRAVCRLRGHEAEVSGVALSADGR
jgi:WD40 repeat protein